MEHVLLLGIMAAGPLWLAVAWPQVRHCFLEEDESPWGVLLGFGVTWAAMYVGIYMMR